MSVCDSVCDSVCASVCDSVCVSVCDRVSAYSRASSVLARRDCTELSGLTFMQIV